MFTFKLLLEVVARTIKEEKKEYFQIGGKKFKISMFADGMMLHMKKKTNLHQEVIRYSKTTQETYSIQKPTHKASSILYTNNDFTEREINKKIQFTVAAPKSTH